ncbi:MAG: GNAT family N-acetyltransferase [Vicinamibacterales bacterium]
MIEIRAATIADATLLAELRWDFRSTQHPPREAHEPFVRRCTAWMRRELQNGSAWKAWVAVDQQVIVGQVWLHTLQKIPNPIAESEQLAYLSNLYVTEAARGGTGTRLLETALASCRASRIDRVVLWPSIRSVTLYVAHGFSHAGDVMELKIR